MLAFLFNLNPSKSKVGPWSSAKLFRSNFVRLCKYCSSGSVGGGHFLLYCLLLKWLVWKGSLIWLQSWVFPPAYLRVLGSKDWYILSTRTYTPRIAITEKHQGKRREYTHSGSHHRCTHFPSPMVHIGYREKALPQTKLGPHNFLPFGVSLNYHSPFSTVRNQCCGERKNGHLLLFMGFLHAFYRIARSLGTSICLSYRWRASPVSKMAPYAFLAPKQNGGQRNWEIGQKIRSCECDKSTRPVKCCPRNISPFVVSTSDFCVYGLCLVTG